MSINSRFVYYFIQFICSINLLMLKVFWVAARNCLILQNSSLVVCTICLFIALQASPQDDQTALLILKVCRLHWLFWIELSKLATCEKRTAHRVVCILIPLVGDFALLSGLPWYVAFVLFQALFNIVFSYTLLMHSSWINVFSLPLNNPSIAL